MHPRDNKMFDIVVFNGMEVVALFSNEKSNS